MDNRKDQCKITIIKDGPYMVSGNVPLYEKIISPAGDGTYEYREGRKLPQAEEYSLCRCGYSKTPPFCDGSHKEYKFNGTETASSHPYMDRVEARVKGPIIDLLDDGRCSYARLCHRKYGDMWYLAKSYVPEDSDDVIAGARECPSGRLVVKDKDGNTLEEDFQPAIEILQDPEEAVSGPIFVKGNIPVESSNGNIYPLQNRLTLCRCGKSSNKPFCDGMHVPTKFVDGMN